MKFGVAGISVVLIAAFVAMQAAVVSPPGKNIDRVPPVSNTFQQLSLDFVLWFEFGIGLCSWFRHRFQITGHLMAGVLVGAVSLISIHFKFLSKPSMPTEQDDEPTQTSQSTRHLGAISAWNECLFNTGESLMQARSMTILANQPS